MDVGITTFVETGVVVGVNVLSGMALGDEVQDAITIAVSKPTKRVFCITFPKNSQLFPSKVGNNRKYHLLFTQKYCTMWEKVVRSGKRQ